MPTDDEAFDMLIKSLMYSRSDIPPVVRSLRSRILIIILCNFTGVEFYHHLIDACNDIYNYPMEDFIHTKAEVSRLMCKSYEYGIESKWMMPEEYIRNVKEGQHVHIDYAYYIKYLTRHEALIHQLYPLESRYHNIKYVAMRTGKAYRIHNKPFSTIATMMHDNKDPLQMIEMLTS